MSWTPPPTVAVLGIGTMGLPMSRNLLAHGFGVRAWNRTSARAEPLRADGADILDTPAEAADGADVVLTMLANGDAVDAVVSGSDGVLAARQRPGLWIQTSTVGVADERRLRSAAATAHLPYVDAPVLGTREPAEQGRLVVLASGPDETRGPATRVLDAIGSRTLWVGPAGAGSRLKLVANAWVLTLTAGVGQSLALARHLGLDPALFLAAISGGAMDVPYAHTKGYAMLRSDYTPSFPLRLAAKDARLVLAASAGDDAPDLSLVRVVLDQLTRAEDHGFGRDDLAAVYEGVRDGQDHEH
ncbi:NAD(P)-dependent oxidoreductase [Actinoalloteichus sp. AHMU CJ021]|uniref:NAD(P)-dependent oxidoreductase n=1 Tax=Actinoalloteichus TaxID=65496 RepID=UPI0004AAFFD0|nr:NAD(P)-dependent oxidoreductase [Actinoalloteichus caeruleus]AUS79481.1 NAD(P)-dependent oxidoreductase [Actinoalloteichus sp. AHMU CJ021]